MPRKIYSIDCTWLIGHGTDINNLVTVEEIADNVVPKRYVDRNVFVFSELSLTKKKHVWLDICVTEFTLNKLSLSYAWFVFCIMLKVNRFLIKGVIMPWVIWHVEPTNIYENKKLEVYSNWTLPDVTHLLGLYREWKNNTKTNHLSIPTKTNLRGCMTM